LTGEERPLKRKTNDGRMLSSELTAVNVCAFFRAVFALADGDELPLGHTLAMVEKTPTGMKRISCRNPEHAVEVIARIGCQSCMYFETSLGPAQVRGWRLSAAEAMSVGHVRLDVDLASPHRGSGRIHPATEADAVNALRPLFDLFTPSLAVRTGHGLHLYWAFKEIVDLTDERERALYQHTASGLHSYASALMIRAGFDRLDNVGDLARIMRAPGSFNCKDPAKPIPVTYEDFGHRYAGPDDLIDALPETELSSPAPVSGKMLAIGGHSSAEVREEATRKIKNILDFEADCEPFASKHRVTVAWNRQPLPNDDSQSCHDFRLLSALSAYKLDWTDDELAAALVIFREACAFALEEREPQYAHEIRQKAMRRDYIARTVARVVAESSEKAVGAQ